LLLLWITGGLAHPAAETEGMFKGFAAFLARGNVIDLAVAVVIGGAFGAVVTALVKDLLTPLVAALFGKPDFATLHFTLNGSVFAYGDFLNALVSFASIAAAIYYVVVLPAEKLRSLREPAAATAAPATCPECLSEIPVGAKRCKFCTAILPG
jgi:large conductance mechanosensitive channel